MNENKARITRGQIGPIVLITGSQDRDLSEEGTDTTTVIIKRNYGESAKNQLKKRERELEKIDVHQMSQKEKITIEEIEGAFKTKNKLKLPKGSKLPSMSYEDIRTELKKFSEGSTERIVGIKMLSKNYLPEKNKQ